MSKEPDDQVLAEGGFVDAAPILAGSTSQNIIPAPAPWEAELDTFWQNVLLNVSTRVETPIHNFLHAETEALRTRLKALL